MAMTKDEVKKRAALYEFEDQFWALVRRRVVLLGAVVAVIGFGGIWAAVELAVQRVAEAPLRELQKEVVRAEVQADAAKRASETARTSSEDVTAGLSTLNTTLQNLGEQAKAVEVQFKRVSEQINAASENAQERSRRDFDAVQRRITALEALVKQIGEENEATRKATSEYAKQMAALESKVEREQKRFAENSAYTVTVVFDASKKALATEVQSRLTALGFRAPVHEVPMAPKGNALTYNGQSEAKAQEVLALVKALVKDVQGKKAPEIVSKLEMYKSEPGQAQELIKKLGGFTFALSPWNLDPKSMQLALGIK